MSSNIHISTFENGLNSDNSKSTQAKNSYTDALNVIITTDEGGSNNALENIKGNKALKNLNGNETLGVPSITSTRKITLDLPYLTSTPNTNAFIQINGFQAPTPILLTIDTTYKEIYDYILNNISFYTGLNSTYRIYYSNNKVVISGNITNPAFGIVSVNTTAGLINSLDVPGILSTDLQILGSKVIRDKIYLITCKTDNSGLTAIWELEYDNQSLITNYKLIYAGNLNCKTDYPIPHSAIEGRYENDCTIKLFWTDFNNPLRFLNVKDSQSMALDTSDFLTKPDEDYTRPVLDKITLGGKLKSGVYTASYRLGTTGGSFTNFSPISNLVFVVAGNEAESVNTNYNKFIEYVGTEPNINCNKIIYWNLNGLDTDFSIIEFYVLYRANKEDIPSVFLFKKDILTSSGKYTAVVDSLEDKTEITYSEFTAINSNFTHCKTLATKDNRLIVGNVRNESVEIPNSLFDARAYRAYRNAPNIVQIYDKDNNTPTTVPITGPNKYIVPDEHDCINPLHKLGTFPYNTGLNYDVATADLKPGNANILGGAGNFIEYEFGTYYIRGDSFNNDAHNPTGGGPGDAPFRVCLPTVNSPINIGNSLENFNQNTVFDSLKYPYKSGLLKGYQRNETYRFGIQFYDKSGTPYFVKWIADIKMPSIDDRVPNNNVGKTDNGLTPDSTWKLCWNEPLPSPESWLSILYVKFKVTIPEALKQIISGYEIVRLERKEEDKTIIAQGITIDVVKKKSERDDGREECYLPDLQNSANLAGGNTLYDEHPYMGMGSNGNINDTKNVYKNNVKIFNSPDILLDKNTYIYQNGDLLRPEYGIKNANTSAAYNNTDERFFLSRLYNDDYNSSYIEPKPIYEAKLLNKNESYEFNYITYVFNNRTLTRVGPAPGRHMSYDTVGTDTLVMVTEALNSASGYYHNDSSKYLCNYYRKRLNQYGGNSYIDRGSSKYITCQAYQKITNTSSSSIETKVFGGDIYMTVFDSYVGIAADNSVFNSDPEDELPDTNINPRPDITYKKIGFAIFYPVETTKNTELRRDLTFNNNFDSNFFGSTVGLQGEDYNYSTVYNAENNSKIFIPRPFETSLCSNSYDNRVYASETKINGELKESWGIYKPFNYWDVEGSYGPITSLNILNDTMYCIQERAFSRLDINPRVLITDDVNGSQLQLGTGNVIQRHDYISTKNGSKHQYGILSNEFGLYFWDTYSNKLLKYRQNEGLVSLSDAKGMHGYFINNFNGLIKQKDNVIKFDSGYNNEGIGVLAGYDYINNRVFFTFKDYDPITLSNNIVTIGYNEKKDVFESFYSFKPYHYISDAYNLLSFVNKDNRYTKSWIHNKGNYGVFYNNLPEKSKVTIILNPSPTISKVFNNISLHSESLNNNININDDTWKRLRIFNDYQNTDLQDLLVNNNITRKERSWNIQIPRNRVLYTSNNSPNIFTDLSLTEKSFGERIRDKYSIVNLEYDNLNNNRLITHYLELIYQMSPR